MLSTDDISPINFVRVYQTIDKNDEDQNVILDILNAFDSFEYWATFKD